MKAAGTMGLLNEKYKYRVRGADESYLTFQYTSFSGISGWYCHQQFPGSPIIIALGQVSEQDVVHTLKMLDHKLDVDDKIDLGLWLASGGLEEFFQKEWDKAHPVKEPGAWEGPPSGL